MRPIRLEVQGLTAYHQPVSVDFTDLDLLAITGPTGAGKSSLVDALTYALYGQVPRVGRSVRELISQGEDRLKVSLEFSINGDRYRIFRESGRKSQKTPQVERWDESADEWQPEEVDRVRETNEFIERLLRMDYEAFIRSVLLPQGQFQEFLAGDRDQRRRVLDGLLRLGVYGEMQRAANAIAARQGDRAEGIRRRLEDELAGATPESLKAAKAGLKELEAEASELKAGREAIEAAWRTADALTGLRDREKTARASLASAEKALEAAQKLLAGGKATLKDVDDRIAAIRKQIEAAQYDSDLHIRLTKALSVVQQRERIDRNLKGLSDDLAKARPEIDRLAKEQASAEKAHADAEKATAAAHEQWEQARTENAALVVQRSLQKGEPCLVCGQVVHELPAEGKAHELDSLKKAEVDAREAEGKALRRLNDVKRDVAVATQRLEGLEKQSAAAQSERERCLAELRELSEEKAERRDVEARIKALEDAKASIETLAAQEKKTIDEREKEAQAIADAQRDAQEREAEIKAHTREVNEASQQAGKLTTTLHDAATKYGWEDVTRAIESGDPASVLRGRRDEMQRRETEMNQAIGAAGKQIEAIAANIEKAKELRAEEKLCREEVRLARDLASLLRADAFPTFIRESALQSLARDGSKRLLEISAGRYDFVVEGQDFLIEDRWNGGERRSVKTLSGGETFLASLALALALAEQLPGLAGDGARGALESLFIDEGFSNLDSDTLDQVASALELLGQDRSRLIGVITHVPALAERMPARIVVHKTQTGSSVSVE